jgi:hypothetical protein
MRYIARFRAPYIQPPFGYLVSHQVLADPPRISLVLSILDPSNGAMTASKTALAFLYLFLSIS